MMSAARLAVFCALAWATVEGSPLNLAKDDSSDWDRALEGEVPADDSSDWDRALEGEVPVDYHQDDNLISKQKRNAMPSKKWPGGKIPYTFDSSINAVEKAAIEKAVAEYNARTCVKWVPRRGEKAHVIFKQPASGCNSPVGTNGGTNTINLGCAPKFPHHIILHEMMHTMGFHHEQNRPDRDQYVDILWDNILERGKSQFNINKKAVTLNQPYDYTSVMHYGSRLFIKANGMYSVLPKDGDPKKIKHNGHLSTIDVKKINVMYGCPNFKGTWQSQDSGTKIICENKQETIRCSNGKKIQVQNAYYGRKVGNVCTQGRGDIRNFSCTNNSSTKQIVERRCNGRNVCTLSASNAIYKESCPNVPKYLEVAYRCV